MTTETTKTELKSYARRQKMLRHRGDWVTDERRIIHSKPQHDHILRLIAEGNGEPVEFVELVQGDCPLFEDGYHDPNRDGTCDCGHDLWHEQGEALRREMETDRHSPTAIAYRAMKSLIEDFQREAETMQRFVDSFDDDSVTVADWDRMHTVVEMVRLMEKAGERVQSNAHSSTQRILIQMAQNEAAEARRREREAK
jgi:hypothetical protein